jgi:hypothetical protein
LQHRRLLALLAGTLLGLVGVASPALAQEYGVPGPGSAASANNVFVGESVGFRFWGCAGSSPAALDIDGRPLSKLQADGQGVVRLSLTFSEAGTFEVRLACTDAAGNPLVQSESVRVRERARPPSGRDESPAEGGAGSGAGMPESTPEGAAGEAAGSAPGSGAGDRTMRVGSATGGGSATASSADGYGGPSHSTPGVTVDGPAAGTGAGTGTGTGTGTSTGAGAEARAGGLPRTGSGLVAAGLAAGGVLVVAGALLASLAAIRREGRVARACSSATE